MTLWPLITGFVGGVIAWLFTTALAQPFQRFLTLRQEAAFALAEFEDRAWIGNPEAKPPTNDWLDKRLAAYDKAGTALVAFASSNSFVTRLLHHPVAGPYRCYVRAAGEGLRVLAATYPGTQAALTYRELVAGQLRITNGLARREISERNLRPRSSSLDCGQRICRIYLFSKSVCQGIHRDPESPSSRSNCHSRCIRGRSKRAHANRPATRPSKCNHFVRLAISRAALEAGSGLGSSSYRNNCNCNEDVALLALTSSEEDTNVPAPPSSAK
jgi:hypothetical protein